MTTWLPSLAGAIGVTVGFMGGFILASAFRLDGVAFFATAGVLGLSVGFAAARMVRRRLER